MARPIALLLMLSLLACSVVPASFAQEATPIPPPSGSSWYTWPLPLFGGQFIASDPTILKDGESYRMFYTCWVPGPHDFSAAICQAVSSDGYQWENVDTGNDISGVMLTGRPGEWDEHLESNFILKRDGAYWLYFSGYRHEGYPAMGYPAALGLAKSLDGITFERVQSEPILAPTPGWYDNEAVYSPAIVDNGGQLEMIYAGHCYTTCEHGYDVTLLGATSEDGIHWTKRDQPVLQEQQGLDWTRDGVAEPGILLAPDGFVYLFFTGLGGEDRAIGVARGRSTFGTWDVLPDPVIVPTPGTFDSAGVLAPDVHLEGDRLRMWFLGADRDGVIAIGYAESPWPFWIEP
jgi:predicted GH43/DUF377 family glycosyl hydrolase